MSIGSRSNHQSEGFATISSVFLPKPKGFGQHRRDLGYEIKNNGRVIARPLSVNTLNVSASASVKKKGSLLEIVHQNKLYTLPIINVKGTAITVIPVGLCGSYNEIVGLRTALTLVCRSHNIRMAVTHAAHVVPKMQLLSAGLDYHTSGAYFSLPALNLGQNRLDTSTIPISVDLASITEGDYLEINQGNELSYLAACHKDEYINLSVEDVVRTAYLQNQYHDAHAMTVTAMRKTHTEYAGVSQELLLNNFGLNPTDKITYLLRVGQIQGFAVEHQTLRLMHVEGGLTTGTTGRVITLNQQIPVLVARTQFISEAADYIGLPKLAGRELREMANVSQLRLTRALEGLRSREIAVNANSPALVEIDDWIAQSKNALKPTTLIATTSSTNTNSSQILWGRADMLSLRSRNWTTMCKIKANVGNSTISGLVPGTRTMIKG